MSVRQTGSQELGPTSANEKRMIGMRRNANREVVQGELVENER